MKPSHISKIKQVLASFIASIAVMIIAQSQAWPAPVIIMIRETGHPMNMTNHQISSIVSLFYAGNIVSPIPSGYMMDYVGCRNSLLILSGIPLTSWIVIYFADSAEMIYGGRIIAGIWSGAASTIVPIYLGEISESKIRGAIISIMLFSYNIGFISVFIFSLKSDYYQLTLFCGSLPIIFIFCFSFVPESPFWLFSKGKTEQAKKSLMWFRGLKEETNELLEELELMEEISQQSLNKRSYRQLFTTKSYRKALLIANVISILQKGTGAYAMIALFAITIPQDCISLLDRSSFMLIAAGFSILVSIISAVLIDSFGRRPLLLISSSSSAVVLFILFLWFLIRQETYLDTSMTCWLPYTMYILFIITYCIGFATVPNAIQGEIFPIDMCGVASGIVATIGPSCAMITSQVYLPIADSIGMYFNYLLYSLDCLIAVCFVWFYLFETKGKSFAEIQQLLEN